MVVVVDVGVMVVVDVVLGLSGAVTLIPFNFESVDGPIGIFTP